MIESPTMHERRLVRKVVDSRLKSVQFMNSVFEMFIANMHSPKNKNTNDTNDNVST